MDITNIEFPAGTGVATISILTLFSPLLLAAILRPTWSKQIKALISFAVLVLLTACGQLLDGQWSTPPNAAFYLIILAAFGAQQGIFTAFEPQLKAIQAIIHDVVLRQAAIKAAQDTARAQAAPVTTTVATATVDPTPPYTASAASASANTQEPRDPAV